MTDQLDDEAAQAALVAFARLLGDGDAQLHAVDLLDDAAHAQAELVGLARLHLHLDVRADDPLARRFETDAALADSGDARGDSLLLRAKLHFHVARHRLGTMRLLGGDQREDATLDRRALDR